jgi:hypothetical protein
MKSTELSNPALIARDKSQKKIIEMKRQLII